jgi:hypothetical protein
MKSKTLHFSWNKRMSMFILVPFFAMMVQYSYGQVGINLDNSAPNASAMLDVKATGLGFLAPRMTLAQRPASPATGLLIYQTDNNPGFYYYNGSTWEKVASGSIDDGDWAYFSGSGLTGSIYHSGDVALGALTDPQSNGLNVQNYTAGKAAVRGVDQNGSSIYAEGMLGVLDPTPLGIPLPVVNAGVLGIKPNLGANGAAVYGWNNDAGNGLNYGGIFASDGAASGTNYGIYSMANNATTNYAGYFVGRVAIESNPGSPDYTSTVFRSEVTHSISTDTYAVEGVSVPTPGYGIGVKGEGGWRGVYGIANSTTYTGFSYGVYGTAIGTAGTRIGVYGTASGGTTNWAGYFAGDVYVSSDLRIGTTTQATGYALSVDGKIACEELLIDNSSFWPDYVFEEDYPLMSIDEFEASIRENKHLPGMVSAKDVEEKGGFHVGDIQKKTLEKVEELSLYIIELNNRVKTLEKENIELKAQLTEK